MRELVHPKTAVSMTSIKNNNTHRREAASDGQEHDCKASHVVLHGRGLVSGAHAVRAELDGGQQRCARNNGQNVIGVRHSQVGKPV